MNTFSLETYKGIVGHGSYQKVIAYLEKTQALELLEKYRVIFEGGENQLDTDDKLLHTYENYLKWVLQNEPTTEQAKEYFFKQFAPFFDNISTWESLETAIFTYFQQQGYYVQFGITPPYPDLYLWKKQTKKVETVKLPETTTAIHVYEMDKVLTRGWYDYLSFGQAGAAGWVNVDGAYYFKDRYDVSSDEFKISLLKHEAQHFVDLKNYPDMNSVNLEYRAKLVELIYYDEPTRLQKFLQMIGDNPDNPHLYANKLIVEDLKKELGDVELFRDYFLVKEASLKLLALHTKGLSKK
ncbi:MAG: hypothetical protein LBV67_12050 [Streptococcaceae bacterium]|jgi:hypothetical protein|nr:hypothetical protein [Streptococcaceae bacterium]